MDGKIWERIGQTLEKNLSAKIDDLELGDLDQMTYKLDTLMGKLQKGIHILSVQGIISRIEKLVTVPTGSVAPRRKKRHHGSLLSPPGRLPPLVNSGL